MIASISSAKKQEMIPVKKQKNAALFTKIKQLTVIFTSGTKK